MGIAKYYEDNLEIMEDRARMKNTEYGLMVRTSVSITVSAPISKPIVKTPVVNNPVLLERVCKCCGKTFPIKQKTAVWFFSRGLHLPKHCRKCLNARTAG